MCCDVCNNLNKKQQGKFNLNIIHALWFDTKNSIQVL